jgi:hypothetical protein
LAGVLAYAPLFSNEFISYDDPDYLTANENLREGLTWNSCCWAWHSRIAANWHPVTWLSHLLDVNLFGEVSPRGTHGVNLALHLGSAILLFILLARSTGRPWPSLAVGLLFLLHPLQVESVAWGAQRKGVLSTFLGIACLGAYGAYGRSQSPGTRWGWYAAAVVLAAMSVAAKPTWVPIALFLLLLDVWPLARPRSWGQLWDKIPFVLLGVAVSWVTLDAQTGAIAASDQLPLHVRLPMVASNYVRYLTMLFWPVDLAVLYPHPLIAPSTGRLLVVSTVLVGVSGIVWAFRRQVPALLVGWAGYLISQVPTIGLVQVGLQEVADRYAYVSFIGLWVALAFGWWSLTAYRGISDRASAGLLLVVASLLGGLTYQQVSLWRDSVTLFTHAANVTRGNYVAYAHLSNAYLERGDLDRAGYYSEQAVAAGLRHPQSLVSLATFLASQRRDQEADQLVQEALARDPRCKDAYLLRAQMAARDRRWTDAAHWARQALAIDPENPQALRLAHPTRSAANPD